MYLPPHFAENRPEVLAAFMRKYPLATVITQNDGTIEASHIPLVLDESDASVPRLHGHFAKANPQARRRDGDAPVLAIFHGPQAYVTPVWYPSKPVNGRVVPTWLYVVVHVEGRLSVVEDPALLDRHLRELTAQQEAARPDPWHVDDAPADYLAATKSRIVPFTITIARVSGKWKLDQNQPAANLGGVAAGLLDAEEQVLSALVGRERLV